MDALHHVGAAAPGMVTPTESDDARELGDSYTGTKRKGCADNTDFAHSDGRRKRLATLQARAALAGFTSSLIEGDDGAPLLVVSRRAMTRAFESLSEAEAWLARVEGKAAMRGGADA